MPFCRHNLYQVNQIDTVSYRDVILYILYIVNLSRDTTVPLDYILPITHNYYNNKNNYNLL